MGIDDYAIIAVINYVNAGILGLAFILLVVFCVLASKTWNWIDIVFVVLTFMAGAGAIFGLSTVTSLRTKVITEVEKYELLAEENKQKADEQILGRRDSVTYDPGSLRYISGELDRQMIGRGRVWSNGQIVADGDNRTFTFSSARPADFEPLQDVVLFAFLESELNGQFFPSRFIGSVRVFAETPGTLTLEPVAMAAYQQFVTPSGNWSLFEKMPLDRRGIFKKAIIAAANSEVSDENAVMKSFLEVQGFGLDPESTEYEALIDRYKAFAESLEDENAELEIGTFREVLMSSFLPAQGFGLDPEFSAGTSWQGLGADLATLDPEGAEYKKLVETFGLDPVSSAGKSWQDLQTDLAILDSESEEYKKLDQALTKYKSLTQYEALIDRYAFDELPIGTIDQWIVNNSAIRLAPRFEPATEEVFVKYEFNAASRTEGYQVDANGSVETDGLFNPLGHAIDQGLKHDGVVTFQKGDTVLVDQQSAVGYQRNGIPIPPFKDGESVTEVDQIYIRQVRDFPYEFGDLTIQSAKADEDIQRVTLSNDVQAKLQADADAQLEERLRIKNDQIADKTNLQHDLDTINALAMVKTEEVSTLRQTIVSLETKIEELYTELRKTAIELSREAFAGN